MSPTLDDLSACLERAQGFLRDGLRPVEMPASVFVAALGEVSTALMLIDEMRVTKWSGASVVTVMCPGCSQKY